MWVKVSACEMLDTLKCMQMLYQTDDTRLYRIAPANAVSLRFCEAFCEIYENSKLCGCQCSADKLKMQMHLVGQADWVRFKNKARRWRNHSSDRSNTHGIQSVHHWLDVLRMVNPEWMSCRCRDDRTQSWSGCGDRQRPKWWWIRRRDNPFNGYRSHGNVDWGWWTHRRHENDSLIGAKMGNDVLKDIREWSRGFARTHRRRNLRTC